MPKLESRQKVDNIIWKQRTSSTFITQPAESIVEVRAVSGESRIRILAGLIQNLDVNYVRNYHASVTTPYMRESRIEKYVPLWKICLVSTRLFTNYEMRNLKVEQRKSKYKMRNTKYEIRKPANKTCQWQFKICRGTVSPLGMGWQSKLIECATSPKKYNRLAYLRTHWGGWVSLDGFVLGLLASPLDNLWFLTVIHPRISP